MDGAPGERAWREERLDPLVALRHARKAVAPVHGGGLAAVAVHELVRARRRLEQERRLGVALLLHAVHRGVAARAAAQEGDLPAEAPHVRKG